MQLIPKRHPGCWLAWIGFFFCTELVTAGPLVGCQSTSPQEPVAQPNIVFLIADDLGYGELTPSASELPAGAAQPAAVPTPQLDQLIRQGTYFSQAYVTGPNCSPSRAGLLTGRTPTRFGYEFNPIGAGNEDPEAGLPPEEVTLPEVLQQVGYTTGLIGKWHLGGAAAYHPFRHGFDEFFGFTHEGHYYVPPPYHGVTTMLRRLRLPGNQLGRWQSGKLIYSTHMGHAEPDYDANNPILRGGQPVVEPAYLTDALTREAVDFVDRNHDRPFFLMVSYNAVHSPLQAADAWMEKMESIDDVHRRIFAAMLANLDDSVGKILRRLDHWELADQTLVVFLSDNGGPTRELTSSNAPLRGEKGSMYEGALRIPMVVRWPGIVEADRVCDDPVSSLDLFVTSAVAAGAELPPQREGVDLRQTLSGRAQAERRLFWRQGRKAALRAGNWKLVTHSLNRNQPQWQLFDLAEDPGESVDLFAEEASRLGYMIEVWNQLNEKMQPARFR